MSFADWPSAPAQPRPAPGAALVFRFCLDLPEERLARLRMILSPDEQARAARFISGPVRERWTAARGQVREILGTCLGRDPAALAFTLNPYGKPALAGGGPTCFNTSHSGSLGMLALTQDQAVGIDLEHVRENLDRAAIAKRFFAPGEVRALLALPAEQQEAAFYACWTRKEAYIKARGMGLSIPLDTFEVSLAPGDSPRLLYPEDGWSMYEIKVGKEYQSALVVEGGVERIALWQWG